MLALKGKTFRTFKTTRENTIWLVGEGLHFNHIVSLLFWPSGSEITLRIRIDVWANQLKLPQPCVTYFLT